MKRIRLYKKNYYTNYIDHVEPENIDFGKLQKLSKNQDISDDIIS
jgi:hypothetical protein